MSKVNCVKHGSVSYVNFEYDGVVLKRVCFICWVNKVTRGLINYGDKK